MAEPAAEEDVNFFRFGGLAEDGFLSNAHLVVVLQSVRAEKLESAPGARLPECVDAGARRARRGGELNRGALPLPPQDL